MNSISIQGHRTYGLILQAFYSSEHIQQVLGPVFLQYRGLMGTEKKLLSLELIAKLFC